MGEKQNDASLRVDFDSSVKVRFVGAQVSSDAGLLAYRELDEHLGLTEMAAEELWDTRCGKNIQHSMLGLVRQAVYGRIAGYEDTNDADYLRHVRPCVKWSGGWTVRSGPPPAARWRGWRRSSCRT
jgi:hypothetical protein